MADQSSGTPRPRGARPFARPYAGAVPGSPATDAKSTPARPALPPFAPASSSIVRGITERDGDGAPFRTPSSVALENIEQVPLAAASTNDIETLTAGGSAIELVVPTDASASNPPRSGNEIREEIPVAAPTYPIVRSRDIWTPEWSPVIVPSITESAPIWKDEEISDHAAASLVDVSEHAISDPEVAQPEAIATQILPTESPGVVTPLFSEMEVEPGLPDGHEAAIGHWTDAPSAEGTRGSFDYRAPAVYADPLAAAPVMEDVSGSLDEMSPATRDEDLARISPDTVANECDDLVATTVAPAVQDAGSGQETASKDRKYAEVLEAVASRVRAGEIQLPVALGASDEAAILAAVLASLLSSR